MVNAQTGLRPAKIFQKNRLGWSIGTTPLQANGGSRSEGLALDHPDTSSSVLLWNELQAGESHAAEAIFLRYARRLTMLARSRLSPRLASRVDPEDIVLSMYRSFFVGARDGRLVVSRGGDLWRLLASMVINKARHQARRHRADMRSIDHERPLGPTTEAQLASDPGEPTPDDALALADELERVLEKLEPFRRRVLELRLQGAAHADIAIDTDRSERTVRRALAEIRDLLTKRLTGAGE